MVTEEASVDTLKSIRNQVLLSGYKLAGCITPCLLGMYTLCTGNNLHWITLSKKEVHTHVKNTHMSELYYLYGIIYIIRISEIC